MSERVKQVEKVARFVGNFFFGTDKEAVKQAEDLAEDLHDQVEERRRRRELNGGPRK